MKAFIFLVLSVGFVSYSQATTVCHVSQNQKPVAEFQVDGHRIQPLRDSHFIEILISKETTRIELNQAAPTGNGFTLETTGIPKSIPIAYTQVNNYAPSANSETTSAVLMSNGVKVVCQGSLVPN